MQANGAASPKSSIDLSTIIAILCAIVGVTFGLLMLAMTLIGVVGSVFSPESVTIEDPGAIMQNVCYTSLLIAIVFRLYSKPGPSKEKEEN